MRYDVYENTEGQGLLLDVQADLLDGLNTRVVVPLLPKNAAPESAKRLNPTFVLNGQDYVMTTQYLAAVPLSILPSPTLNLGDHQDQIRDALDMLFSGF